jgi:hypothetical protein
MTLIDGDGKIKAYTKMLACGWLRTVKADDRIRLSCAELNPSTPLTIYGWTVCQQFPGLDGNCQLTGARYNSTANPFAPTDTPNSQGVFANQFRVFTNGSEVVFAFKGSP